MSEIDWGLIAARMLRKMGPAATTDFLNSTEWAALPTDARDALYVADALIEEEERTNRST
jgi:hypothetical protein